MALSAPPFAQQNASHSAALFRQAAGSSFWQAHGVLGYNDFQVAAQATPNMSVQVNAGQAWVQGTSSGLITGIGVGAQGSYYALSDTAATLSINAANGTNPRIDVVYLRILDTAVGDGSNTAILGVQPGTPAASPLVPTLPANCLDLAHVRVGAGVTSITNSNITLVGRDTAGLNVVNQAIPGGVVLIATEAGLPGLAARNPQVGQLALAGDTYNMYLHIGSGQWLCYGNANANWNTAVYASAPQTGIATNTFATISLSTPSVGGMYDGTGITISANGTGYYLIDGMVQGTNFGSGVAEFTCYFTVNGNYLPTSNGQRSPVTGSGTAWHTGVALGARVVSLQAGDVLRLVGLANTTWDTYAPNSTTTSWLSVTKVGGGLKIVA